MDLISNVERTAAPGSCYGAFTFGGGWEIPYHCIKSGMVDDLGGGEGWWHLGLTNSQIVWPCNLSIKCWICFKVRVYDDDDLTLMVDGLTVPLDVGYREELLEPGDWPKVQAGGIHRVGIISRRVGGLALGRYLILSF